MSESRVRGYYPPLGIGPVFYSVEWPDHIRGLDVTLLGDAWIGVPIHWSRDPATGRSRTVWCPGPHLCERCDMRRQPEMRAYIAAWDHYRRRVIAVNVGRNSLATVLSLVPDSRPMYLVRVRLVRTEPRITSAVAASIDSSPPYRWAGPWPDLTPTLERIYGAGCLSGGHPGPPKGVG